MSAAVTARSCCSATARLSSASRRSCSSRIERESARARARVSSSSEARVSRSRSTTARRWASASARRPSISAALAQSLREEERGCGCEEARRQAARSDRERAVVAQRERDPHPDRRDAFERDDPSEHRRRAAPKRCERQRCRRGDDAGREDEIGERRERHVIQCRRLSGARKKQGSSDGDGRGGERLEGSLGRRRDRPLRVCDLARRLPPHRANRCREHPLHPDHRERVDAAAATAVRRDRVRGGEVRGEDGERSPRSRNQNPPWNAPPNSSRL